MLNIRYFVYQLLIFCCIFILIFTSSSHKLYAEEIEWLEVSSTSNELLYINPNSIKYNNRGFLSVIAKYHEIDQDSLTFESNDPFLMAIDCENRLFSELPLNADLKQVKNWKTSTDNKLIKKTIINSCSY